MVKFSRDCPGIIPGLSRDCPRPFPEISWEFCLCVSLFFPGKRGKTHKQFDPHPFPGQSREVVYVYWFFFFAPRIFSHIFLGIPNPSFRHVFLHFGPKPEIGSLQKKFGELDVSWPSILAQNFGRRSPQSSWKNYPALPTTPFSLVPE